MAGGNPIRARERARQWAKDHPERARANNARWQKAHPENARARGKRWRQRNPEKVRAAKRRIYWRDPEKHRRLCMESHRRNKYGLGEEGFAKMWASQDGKCQLCSITLEKRRGRYAIDHDHETGLVRSILCVRCNTMLSHLEADDGLLERMQHYIRQHKLTLVS